MSLKRENRERRKAERLEKFAATKATLVAKVIVPTTPTSAPVKESPHRPKLAPHLVRDLESEENTVKVAPTNQRASKVTWCASKGDVEGIWSWGENRQWTEAEWGETIKPTLDGFKNLTWQEVDDFSSGSGHKSHHSQDLATISYEAQLRWAHLKLHEFDNLFRFRLGGTKRVWGYIVQSHFYAVWWERYHKIYDVSKK